MDTAFGYTVSGLNGKRRNSSSSSSIGFSSASDQVLKEELRSIFYQDFPHMEHNGKVTSREAEYAREQLKESIKWDEVKGKYSVGLPYKFGREKTAEILNSVDSGSMEKNPAKKGKAFSETAKFLDKGRCEKLTKEEIERQEKEGLPIWNLPFHLVLQRGKYRFCHDARASVGGITDSIGRKTFSILNVMLLLTQFVPFKSIGLLLLTRSCKE